MDDPCFSIMGLRLMLDLEIQAIDLDYAEIFN